ncbi:unnamed protein product, partial [Rotaria sp. Silwood1]
MFLAGVSSQSTCSWSILLVDSSVNQNEH